jgi:hypothetical protein
MRFADKADQLRVDMVSAVLGVPMLEVDQVQSATDAPVEAIPPTVFWIAEGQGRQILATLDTVVAELQGMRADLASRTWGARWLRLVAWWRRMVLRQGDR